MQITRDTFGFTQSSLALVMLRVSRLRIDHCFWRRLNRLIRKVAGDRLKPPSQIDQHDLVAYIRQQQISKMAKKAESGNWRDLHAYLETRRNQL